MIEKSSGYAVSWQGDILTVHGVPIFCECERGGMVFDAEWIDRAVAHAENQQKGTYLPPLHIRHHRRTRDDTEVRAAGFFKITGTESISYLGKSRKAVVADLIINDKDVQQDVLAMKYPYRSVEIMDVSADPEIDSLALLDHEAPFLALPMLMVSQDASNAVAAGKWSMEAENHDSPMVACFRKGSVACLLMKDISLSKDQPMSDQQQQEPTLFSNDPTDDDDKKKAGGEPDMTFEEPDAPAAREAADESADDAADAPQADAMDVAAVVSTIESGTITINDMDAILAAINAQKSAADAVEEPAQALPAAAATPGAQIMEKQPSAMSAEMAELAGKNVALEKRLSELEQERVRDKEVAAAMERFSTRPMGSLEDLEDGFLAFHKEHGAQAFAAYVDGIAKNIGVMPDKTTPPGGDLTNYSEIALSYQDQGTDAVDKAYRFEKDWESLKNSGLRVDRETYVAINMARTAKQEN